MATILHDPKRTSDEKATSKAAQRVPWVPDSQVTNCGGCGAEFSFSLRKHHCRNCGNIFCWQCSAHKIELPKLGYSGPQRICNKCYAKLADDHRARENALTTVQLLLRDMPYFQFVEPLLSIGRRGPPSKWFSSISVQGMDELHCISIIELGDNGTQMWGDTRRRPYFASLLKEVISHPYISDVIFAQVYDKKAAIIRQFFPHGSLKDLIYGKKPQSNYIEKYSGPGKPLKVTDIQRYGRQVLDALFYLHVHGFPFPHLHTGNVMLNGNNIALCDIENTLCCMTPVYMSQLQESNAKLPPEVLCFGHFLFEMALGFPKENMPLESVKDKCPSEVYGVLEYIFSATDPENAPSIKSLLKHPFFKDVQMEVKIHASVLKEEWDPKIRGLLKLIKQVYTQLFSQPAAASALPRRDVSIRRSVTVSSITSSSSSSATITKSSSSTNLSTSSSQRSGHVRQASALQKPAAPSAPAPPPPPPPPPPSNPPTSVKDLPPPQEGRALLLESIRQNNMARLRKVTPNEGKKK